MRRQRTWAWWWLVAILGLAFAVRTLSLEAQGLWRDEVDALRFATAPWPEMWDRFTRPGWNGPFYFLMLRGWIVLTGRSAFAMRYLSTLWGLVGVALFYALSQRLFDVVVARWSVVLVAFSPYLIWYAQEVKMYTWVPMLVLLALYALDRICRGGRWAWWIVLLLATVLAIYSHILAALLIPLEVLWFILRQRRRLFYTWTPLWLGGAVVLILLALFYKPLLSWQLPLIFQQRETGYAARTLWEMAQILVGGWGMGITGWGDPVIPVGSVAVALFGCGYLVRKRHLPQLIALLVWLTGPLLAVWAVSLRGPIFTDRYLIWSAPAFYLAMGLGLVGMGRLWRGLPALLILGALLGNGVNLYRQVVEPIKPQFREASAYLMTHRSPDALLLFQIPYNQIVVDYYTPGTLDPWAEAPYTNWRNDDGTYTVQDEAVGEQMAELLAGYTDVWLVYSEVAMWDDRELVKSWLSKHGVQVAVQHFHMVDLYHFRLPETAVPRGCGCANLEISSEKGRIRLTKQMRSVYHAQDI